jgi:hypothetical protein
MNTIYTVHVFQTSPSTQQLTRSEERSNVSKDHRTNFNLGASGKCVRYSLKFPYSIHAEMVESGEIVMSTPSSGIIFGWLRFAQVMTSL